MKGLHTKFLLQINHTVEQIPFLYPKYRYFKSNRPSDITASLLSFCSALADKNLGILQFPCTLA